MVNVNRWQVGLMLAWCALASILSSNVATLASVGSAASLAASAEQRAANLLTAVQDGFATLLMMIFAIFIQATAKLLPGLVLAFGGVTLFRAYKDGSLSRPSWGRLAFILIGGIAILGGLARLGGNTATGGAASPSVGSHGGQAAPLGGGGMSVHSGEEVLTGDGSIVRRADPRQPAGALANPGWQQELAGSIAQALQGGKEQVVLVFSRQGCPWCDRQMPVIQEAIKRRASAAGVMPGMAFVGGGGMGGNMLFAPLRVFVLDAGEFPQLAQQFNIEAFPTSLIFGPPRVDPLKAQGFVDDSQLDQILRTAATSAPGEGPRGGAAAAPKRRRLFR
eukprot:TRINITY_DN106881_c0_g1_i1.p1 TRINITY_DN106881_c0_g1~~TRINITY_DN106881_c0_g1_i1.p1  ORF type:complete len:356 (+),score=52.37 TRINITY_DN106881_c0_g1_i1:66-1070(+)